MWMWSFILASWAGIIYRMYQLRHQFNPWSLYFGGAWMVVGLALLVEPTIEFMPMTVFWFSMGLFWFLIGLKKAA